MNLKESFRYQNFLESLITKANIYLTNPSNVTKIAQTHLRKKANPEAEDETIDLTSERQIQVEVNTIVDFLVHIVHEKELLSAAISSAKAACGTDIDGAVVVNKCKQQISGILSSMANIKPSERITQGKGFKFNAEGNQTQYIYDVKQVTTIDFDRNKVRGVAKKLIAESDDTSRLLDKLMVDVQVEYAAPYDVNDNFDDVLDEFVSKKAA